MVYRFDHNATNGLMNIDMTVHNKSIGELLTQKRKEKKNHSIIYWFKSFNFLKNFQYLPTQR